MLNWIPCNKAGQRKREEAIRRFRRLYPNQDGEANYRCFKLRRLAFLLFLLLVTAIIAVFSNSHLINSQRLTEGYLLQRPEWGEIKTSLQYKSENGIQGQLKLMLRAPKKTGEDLEKFLLAIRTQLESELLGGNNIEKVTKKLSFPEKIAGYSVQWKFDTHLLRMDGELKNEEIASEGTVTIISAILEYYGEEIEFQIPVRLFPKEKSEEEKQQEDIITALKIADEESLQNTQLLLPSEAGGQQLIWNEKEKSGQNQLILLLAAGAVCLIAGMEQDLKKKEKKRLQQMISDYPDIISKFTLLMGAGMTIRGAWERIVEGYQNRKGLQTHFAYEEMRITLHELELGMSESAAYERFGRRCAMLPYMKFSTILVQNLRKGSKSMIPLLEQEAEASSAERRELAKRLGEEAGTRLLGPMAILLLLALLIVLVPAFAGLSL